MLADYVGNFYPAIIGLSGSEEEIARLLKAFDVIRIKEGAGQKNNSYARSTNTYLLGRHGVQCTVNPQQREVGPTGGQHQVIHR